MAFPQALGGYDRQDEGLEKEQEVLFERRLQPPAARPFSANESELDKRFGAKKAPRPVSARKQALLNRRSRLLAQKDSEGSFLVRLKPRQIPMDKERLYEENMSLKFKNNTMKGEMVKLRTKINQLEREVARKDELLGEFRGARGSTGALNKLRIVTGLKSSIRDLRAELQARDSEITKLRKNIKNSRNEELAVELKTYSEECTRLTHHLQEVMRDKDSDQRSTHLEEKHYQQTVAAKNLRRENEELAKSLSGAREETRKWKERFLETDKKKKNTHKGENSALKAEVKKLRALLEAADHRTKNTGDAVKKENLRLNTVLQETQAELDRNKKQQAELEQLVEQLRAGGGQHAVVNNSEFKQVVEKIQTEMLWKPRPPKLFRKIHKAAGKKNMLVSVFLSLLDKNNNGYIEYNEFISGMKANGEKVKKKDIDEILKGHSGRTNGQLPLRFIEENYEKYDYDNSSSSSSSSSNPSFPEVLNSQVTHLFAHIAFTMQLHRVQRESILTKLFESPPSTLVSQQELAELFTQEPFKFPDSELLARFLLQPEHNPKSISQIQKTLNSHLEDWAVYSPEDEENYDKHIIAIVNQHEGALTTLCQQEDIAQSGSITTVAFKRVLGTLSVDFSAEVWKYLTLLFYSQNNQLGVVPYLSFIEAYTGSSQTMSQEEAAVIVREQLTSIAELLNASGTTLKDTFKVDGRGLISAGGFVEGLKRIGFDTTEAGLVELMLEALQFEGQPDQVWVSFEELENILSNYGVGTVKGKEEDVREQALHGREVVSELVSSESFEGEFKVQKSHSSSLLSGYEKKRYSNEKSSSNKSSSNKSSSNKSSSNKSSSNRSSSNKSSSNKSSSNKGSSNKSEKKNSKKSFSESSFSSQENAGTLIQEQAQKATNAKNEEAKQSYYSDASFEEDEEVNLKEDLQLSKSSSVEEFVEISVEHRKDLTPSIESIEGGFRKKQSNSSKSSSSSKQKSNSSSSSKQKSNSSSSSKQKSKPSSSSKKKSKPNSSSGSVEEQYSSDISF